MRKTLLHETPSHRLHSTGDDLRWTLAEARSSVARTIFGRERGGVLSGELWSLGFSWFGRFGGCGLRFGVFWIERGSGVAGALAGGVASVASPSPQGRACCLAS